MYVAPLKTRCYNFKIVLKDIASKIKTIQIRFLKTIYPDIQYMGL